MANTRLRFADIFASRRMAVLFALGFGAGLPYSLTGAVLTIWLTDALYSADRAAAIKTIGAFSLVGLAYTFKFAWAPLLDRYRLPWLGRRRGWLITFQLLLVPAIAVLGSLDPRTSLAAIAVAAAVVAVCSASQDVILDAYMADLLPPEQRAAGSASYVMGYRVALLVTGTLALIIADLVPWQAVYWGLAGLMGLAVVATLMAEEPPAAERPPRTLLHAVWLPFKQMLTRRGVLWILLFVALYKFGDHLADAQKSTFLRGELQFTKTELATLQKILGFAGILLGAGAAGLIVARAGVRRALIAFGVLQASTNLLFTVMAIVGKNYGLLAASVLADNITGAMGTTAFVAFLMAQTDREVSATQYALLTSLSSVGNRVFGWTSGDLVNGFGFAGFYATTAAIAIPGILLATFMPREATDRVPTSSTR